MSDPYVYAITLEELDPQYDKFNKFEDVKCELCESDVGWTEKAFEDGYGREYDKIVWITTYRVSNGILLCEDCGYPLIARRKA